MNKGFQGTTANVIIQDYTLLDNPVLITKTVSGRVSTFDVIDRTSIFDLWNNDGQTICYFQL